MILLYSVLIGLMQGVFRLLFNFYVLSLGEYDEQFLGLLTSVASLSALLTALPVVYLVGRFSSKRLMLSLELLRLLAFIGLLLYPYRVVLIGFNIIYGIINSTRQVVVAPFLMENTSEEERQYVFSLYFGMATFAQFFGNMIGGMLPTWLGDLAGALPTDTLSYQLTLCVMIVISTMGMIPIIFISARKSKIKSGKKVEMPWTLLRQYGRMLFKLILPELIIGLGAGMLMPFMNIYYRNVFGQSDAIIGYVFASGALAMGLAQIIAPIFVDRFGKINIMVITRSLSIPFLLTLAFAAWIIPRGGDATFWFVAAWAAYLFRTSLMNLNNPIYQTFILEHVPVHVQALAISMLGLSFRVGWTISPQISGWIQVRYGFVPVVLITAGLYVIGITVLWIFFHDINDRSGDGQAQIT